jgi:hypothetical protein
VDVVIIQVIDDLRGIFVYLWSKLPSSVFLTRSDIVASIIFYHAISWLHQDRREFLEHLFNQEGGLSQLFAIDPSRFKKHLI